MELHRIRSRKAKRTCARQAVAVSWSGQEVLLAFRMPGFVGWHLHCADGKTSPALKYRRISGYKKCEGPLIPSVPEIPTSWRHT